MSPPDTIEELFLADCVWCKEAWPEHLQPHAAMCNAHRAYYKQFDTSQYAKGRQTNVVPRGVYI